VTVYFEVQIYDFLSGFRRFSNDCTDYPVQVTIGLPDIEKKLNIPPTQRKHISQVHGFDGQIVFVDIPLQMQQAGSIG
jgi:hypothetical protein